RPRSGRRPHRGRSPGAPMSLRLGIDYGGTSTKLILGSPEPGRTPTPVAEQLIDSPRGGHALAALARAGGDFLGSHRIATAGISVPGLIGAEIGRASCRER